MYSNSKGSDLTNVQAGRILGCLQIPNAFVLHVEALTFYGKIITVFIWLCSLMGHHAEVQY